MSDGFAVDKVFHVEIDAAGTIDGISLCIAFCYIDASFRSNSGKC
ncbi:hypothetical protein SDC9_142752 [bioreactor metagenome]|uniref:Uncharacterized protein n=1 Tax=bioreactor metagenome TaxID=1076179 RepID=A0A645E1P8_9ZZZZ